MYATRLRQELCERNRRYAAAHGLPHVLSYGEFHVVVYEPCGEERRHGNFLPASYRAILKNENWQRRLDKVHTSARQCLPQSENGWRELDSCVSSDALLMNVFCHPSTLKTGAVRQLLSLAPGEVPEFGFMARVPMAGGRFDRTEVDMRCGPVLFESKLTEADFQGAPRSRLEGYRDFAEVFQTTALPKSRGRICSYQLIRNVLAAFSLQLEFCVLLDARRPDLIEACYDVFCCVRNSELRTRCKVLTWQELSAVLPRTVRTFLDVKYAIVAPGQIASVSELMAG